MSAVVSVTAPLNCAVSSAFNPAWTPNATTAGSDWTTTQSAKSQPKKIFAFRLRRSNVPCR